VKNTTRDKRLIIMANSENQKLLTEFPPISTQQWEEKIQQDLKGADYEKKLVWRTLEGFKVQPYYRSEHLKGKEYLDTLPGEFPFTRGANPDNNWEIRQDIDVSDIKTANENALFILDRGVTSLGFTTGSKKGANKINSVTDLDDLLKDIHIDCIGLYFESDHNTPEIVKYLSELVAKNKLPKENITGSACYDPLGYLTIKGAWGTNEEADFTLLKETISLAESTLPNYRVLTVNGQHFTNAGASVVQELGFSLAMAADYLSKLTESGLKAASIAKHLQLNLGVGTNYFMEIAKVRAARYLFAKLFEAFGVKQTVFINSFTSNFQNTIYDPYVNVLRATTESMAAVLGGADALVVKPFDQVYKKSNKISDRISRNIQIILKEESYFDKISDPSAGSYYIENLTDSVIDEAWKLFLEIDEKGGYLTALKNGIVQSTVEETAITRSNNIATRREILLGTNQYPNFNEEIKSNIDTSILNTVDTIEGEVVKTIKKFRGAIAFEALRLATENATKRPKVFMLTYGNLAFRKARATFACNFFACAGYEVVDNLGFHSAEEGVKAAQNAKADIIVVCSSDDEYAEFVPQVKELVGKSLLVVAGAPKCMDELKAKGIENFIHVKSNVLETLQGFNKQLGIK
jgi:methylmalonyl-CoA mutase